MEENSVTFDAYKVKEIHERHRHRYEVNNAYRDMLVENGLSLSGLSPDGRLVEIVEIREHPWFVGVQFHPELKSRPTRPHPLFREFVRAAVEYNETKKSKAAAAPKESPDLTKSSG